jgi:hypothetical protein
VPEEMHTTPAYSPTGSPASPTFVDRRDHTKKAPGAERRQFASSHQGLSDEARELALAIDGYKLEHRRRYITFEEMLHVIRQLGYHK